MQETNEKQYGLLQLQDNYIYISRDRLDNTKKICVCARQKPGYDLHIYPITKIARAL